MLSGGCTLSGPIPLKAFTMANEVWSFLETDGETLLDTAKSMAAEAKRTAKIFNATPAGVIFIRNPEYVIEKLQPYGLEKLYCCRHDLPLTPEISSQSILTAAIELSPQFLLFADTPLGSDMGTRVAAGLERGFVAACKDFSIEATAETPLPVARKGIYGGKADALITWTTPAPYLAGIALEALEATKAPGAGQPEIVDIPLTTLPAKTQLKKSWAVPLSQLDLSEAKIAIGVGKGVNPHQMALVKRLHGASRELSVGRVLPCMRA